MGTIEEVNGEQRAIERDDASAVVSVKTNRGEESLVLGLTREHRLWKISKLPELL